MIRGLALATLVLMLTSGIAGQAVGVLRIKVSLVDAQSRPAPVSRHAFLISENPTSAPPRVIVTGADGTVDVKLRAGNYTVESERAVAFEGKTYEWVQLVDIVAGRDTVIELTAANADTSGAAAPPKGSESDPSFLLSRFQDSVVALWTPTTPASGLLVDANGLIATNQRVVGTATSVEVQVADTRRVEAIVLAADAVRDVAVLWIDPKAAAALRPLPLPCRRPEKTPVIDRQQLFAIGAPFRQQKRLTSGSVITLDARGLVSDLLLVRGAPGGPVFTAAGDVIGLTSILNDKEQTDRGTSRVIRDDFVCDVIGMAEKKMQGAARPSETPLPMEPGRAFPVAGLKAAAERHSGRVTAYKVPSDTFDVALITPVLTYLGRLESEQSGNRLGYTGARLPDADQLRLHTLSEFGTWADYVSEYPPVLLIRATPRLVEGFWTTVGRFAARTQGVALPPIKRFKAGFSRLRAFCGDAEVTPIHRFKLEQRVSETEAIYEGLYAFDPGALGPECGTVKLTLFSEKEPQKGDTRVVDPGLLQQVWEDFAAYRSGGG
jgi:S1-C subfamily serine protease